MARRKKSCDEQISRLNEQICKLQNKIEDLSQQKKCLLQQQREEEISELYDLMKSKNLSIDDIYGMLQIEEEQTA